MEKEVTFHLRIFNASTGELLDSTADGEPMRIEIGKGQIFPPVESLLATGGVKEAMQITIPAVEAFGVHRPEAIVQLSRSDLHSPFNPQIGDIMVADLGGEERAFVVKSIDEEHILADFNHPLAGIDIEAHIDVVEG